ncbi:MAG: TerC family protein [Candidatus Omnitrophota bacterium]
MEWIIFGIVILGMLYLDLGVLNRKAHTVGMREALLWSAVWIGAALLFNVMVYYFHGPQRALQFFTAYLIEKALSIDNLFVFLLIFTHFRVPAEFQHKVLFWGILGALVFRAIFIAAGVALIHHFQFMFYVFGAILIWSGVRFAVEKEKEVHPEKNPVVAAFRRFFPVTMENPEGRFLVKKDGKTYLTVLFLVLMTVETTDLVFALDSIPAVLAVSLDPFIVYTSNIFAILGLRALFFALAALMKIFRHLHYGLAVILVYIGVKMIVMEFVHIPIGASLAVIALSIAISILTSVASLKRPGV